MRERQCTRDEAMALARDIVQGLLRYGWTIDAMRGLTYGHHKCDGSDLSVRLSRGVAEAPYWSPRWRWTIEELASAPDQLSLFGGAPCAE